MHSESFSYHAYIIHVWKETAVQCGNKSGDSNRWRFTLSTPDREGRQGFTTPEALCDTLYQAVQKVMQNEQIPEAE